MIYLDNNYDWNDQLAAKYLLYKGIYYDIGTKVKINSICGVQDAVFTGWQPYTGQSFQMECACGEHYGSSFGANQYIVEILEPVYADLSEYIETDYAVQRQSPPKWDIEMGWIWYITIMLVGIIFKERLLIWLLTSAIFFGWKFGFLNGGKK